MDNILKTVKTLLGIEAGDITQDDILRLYIEIVMQSIINYCNIEKLPEALYFEAAQMVVDLKNGASTNAADTAGKVSSISEAGRTVSFDAAGAHQAVNAKLADRKTQLDRFKLIYRG